MHERRRTKPERVAIAAIPDDLVGEWLGGEKHHLALTGKVRDGETDVRSECPHEKHDFFARKQLFGHAYRITRRAIVVAKDDFQRTTQHAARRIDFRLRELHALLVRLEELWKLLVAVELSQTNRLRERRGSKNTGGRNDDGGERSNAVNHDDSEGDSTCSGRRKHGRGAV